MLSTHFYYENTFQYSFFLLDGFYVTAKWNVDLCDVPCVSYGIHLIIENILKENIEKSNCYKYY